MFYEYDAGVWEAFSFCFSTWAAQIRRFYESLGAKFVQELFVRGSQKIESGGRNR